MLLFALALISLSSHLCTFAVADPACPNTLAIYNPNIRTMCSNSTWFILPVETSKVESVTPYPLITPPYSNKTIFPTDFPAGTHPVVVSSAFGNDIRMINLQIPALKMGSIYVPYTDRLGDGETPFNYPVRNYIGGVDGQTQAFVEGLVPALVGTAEGTTLFVATITPNNDAYAPIASSPNEFSTEVKQVIVENTLSGPSVEPEAFDLDFTTAKTPLYTARTFHELINQPIILNNGECQRNTNYFNNTFTAPVLRSGNATLVGPIAGNVPTALAGQYSSQGGYSASSEVVGYNPETCKSAAANVDPSALQ